MIITIDSGTTNTRIALFDPHTERIVNRIAIPVGVRDNAFGDSSRYKPELKKAIDAILEGNSDVTAIIASGMICSELGLYNLPHATAPADTEKLKKLSETRIISEVSSIPITFIPGVKNDVNNISIDNISEFDMMRGEETEVFGIMKLLNLDSSFTAVLPGSHTKLISINSKGEIEKCQTTIAGELLSCVSGNTIIKKTLTYGLTKEIDEECLKKGFLLSRKNGFTNTAFKVRCAGLFANLTPVQLSSFFTGAALADDIELILQFSDNNRFVIGGSNPLKKIFEILIHLVLPDANIIAADSDTVSNCTSIGALTIIN